MSAKKTAKKTATKNATAKRVPAKSPAKKTARVKAPAAKASIGKRTAAKRPTVKGAPTSKLNEEKIQGSSSFAKAQSKAEEYAKDPKKLGKLFQDAAAKAKDAPKGPFGETWAYFQAMIRLVRAYANGSYRDIPVASLLLILVAVVYFVSPVDFIPDAIPGIGLIDDALVVSLAAKQVRADLDAFMAWEIERG